MRKNIFFILFVGLLLSNATVSGMKRKREDSGHSYRTKKRRKLVYQRGEPSYYNVIQRNLVPQIIILTQEMLFDAIVRDDANRVAVLLRNGVDAHSPGDFNGMFGWTPLHFAVFDDRTEIVKMLLEEGVSANTVDVRDASVLELAVLIGNTDTAAILLQNGANPNQLNRDGLLPFHTAIWRGCTDIFKMLINAGANFTKKNSFRGNGTYGKTPLECLRYYDRTETEAKGAPRYDRTEIEKILVSLDKQQNEMFSFLDEQEEEMFSIFDENVTEDMMYF